MTGEDAAEFILAGATCVSVGMANFVDPCASIKIAHELEAWAESQGVKDINELYKRGVNVLDDNIADVHVSGHACREELKLIHALVKPDNFVPVHGEYRHLVKHAALAR